jgi:hypothetical protein
VKNFERELAEALREQCDAIDAQCVANPGSISARLAAGKCAAKKLLARYDRDDADAVDRHIERLTDFALGRE